MLQNKTVKITCIRSFLFFFVHLQVDNNHGLLLKSEKETSLSSSPIEPLLKRQTASAHLRGQYQASIKQKKANQAKQDGAEQAEEVKGAPFSSQTSFQTNGHHQPSTQTQLLPQPYSAPQARHIKGSIIPSNGSTDHPKVSCFFQHTYIHLPSTTWNV